MSAVASGVALACVVWFVFVASVTELYESRGSPALSVDPAALGVAALLANVVLLALIVAAGSRAARTRER